MAASDSPPRLNGDACGFCGGRRLKRFIGGRRQRDDKEAVRVVECPRCQVAWQWPLGRTAEDSEAHYEQRYSGTGSKDCRYFDPRERAAAAQAQLQFILRLGRERRGSLLDVGAGMGYFVGEACAAGFDAVGVEPSRRGADAANARLERERVIRGTIDDLPAGATFDVVTLWDVIEHVEMPLELIQQAAGRLGPGGWLVIETGNYQSNDRIKNGTSWWAFHPEHRWYFAPPVIEGLMRRAGLTAIVHADTVFRPDYHPTRDQGASAAGLLRQTLKTPWQLPRHAAEFIALRAASRRWPDWVGLPIFTLAGRVSAPK
jgi:2-polyprenyl-3-methyl-5-hydroxy-6-metoxy-1,4-benzoquinol methylase